MKCHYCGKPAVKINITETRLGSGTTTTRMPACKVHAGLTMGDYCNLGILGAQNPAPKFSKHYGASHVGE